MKTCNWETDPILIIHSASADASADKSAAKYSEVSANLGRLESDF